MNVQMQINPIQLHNALWFYLMLLQIRIYIKQTWRMLTHSLETLVASAPNLVNGNVDKIILYVACDEDRENVRIRVRESLSAADFTRVEIRQLPPSPENVCDVGLLYLPFPYVSPGGRFKGEQFGWDSYFTVLGLLRDGEIQLAKNMVDNCIYMVFHYGWVLNSNRSYYLNRSHPPFLTAMVLAVFDYTRDIEWLENILPALEKYYAFWIQEPHLTPQTGLSRYHGGVDTPAPEVVHGELDEKKRNHYDRVREYFRTHDIPGIDVSRYYDKEKDELTPAFYLADNTMRELAFDPTFRFGPLGIATLSYNPVCLNSLLYRYEKDMALINILVGGPQQTCLWEERARRRAETINNLMWNETAGLFFDYCFESREQSDYRYLTVFYTLWAGLATPEQAKRIISNLPIFEQEWGLAMSDRETHCQWDYPYGWAPLHILVIDGMRRYGFHEDANRISLKFLSLVLRDFVQHGVIREKYNVVTGGSDLSGNVWYGYDSNEIGFGWTNAAFVILHDNLSQEMLGKVVITPFK